jgi:CHAT domain-containing protein
VLHLAAHAVLDDRDPLYSHVVLSQAGEGGQEDGLLEARELMDLELDAELAVLSACQTARGRVAPGEGVIGMSWALAMAGVPTTLVSQWPVDSAATRALMIAFHRERLAGQSHAAALRRAARALLADARYRHPYYWGGFVLVGDAS